VGLQKCTETGEAGELAFLTLIAKYFFIG